MGAPKAEDRDHAACRMAQSGFESFDHKTSTNQLGMQSKLGCSRSSNCKKERDRGVEKTTQRVGVKLVMNRKRRSTASSNPVHKVEK